MEVRRGRDISGKEVGEEVRNLVTLRKFWMKVQALAGWVECS